MCTDMSEKFPTLYQVHSVSHHISKLFLKQNVVPFNFATQSLLNFDAFLGVRNLLTIGCSSTSIDLVEVRERNTVFMQVAFD